MPRPTSTQRRKDDPILNFYNTKEWKNFRARFVAAHRHKGCAICQMQFDQRDQVHVDHIRPIRTHWHLRLHPDNVRCLHAGCHTNHTFNRAPKPRINADGFPPDWQ